MLFNLDLRQLDAHNWTQDNWKRVTIEHRTIGRDRQLVSMDARQLDALNKSILMQGIASYGTAVC